MKLSVQETEKRFGPEVVKQLTDMQAEPTGRIIYPAFEPQHKGMSEYVAGSLSVDGGTLSAYYFQPEDADEWEYGEMNGIEYGDIEYIEFVEDN